MLHLSLSGVVHKDLAARNILVNREWIGKVADFGLSYSSQTFFGIQTIHMNHNERDFAAQPVKWTAVESIRERIFNTQSDGM
jgi:hypothetical protein